MYLTIEWVAFTEQISRFRSIHFVLFFFYSCPLEWKFFKHRNWLFYVILSHSIQFGHSVSRLEQLTHFRVIEYPCTSSHSISVEWYVQFGKSICSLRQHGQGASIVYSVHYHHNLILMNNLRAHRLSLTNKWIFVRNYCESSLHLNCKIDQFLIYERYYYYYYISRSSMSIAEGSTLLLSVCLCVCVWQSEDVQSAIVLRWINVRIRKIYE